MISADHPMHRLKVMGDDVKASMARNPEEIHSQEGGRRFPGESFEGKILSRVRSERQICERRQCAWTLQK